METLISTWMHLKTGLLRGSALTYWTDIFNLVQHVKGETHRNGHTLDLIITRSDETSLVSNVHITDPVISDHFAVHCRLAIKKSNFPRKEISYWKVIQVDRENFREAIIRNSPLLNFEPISIIPKNSRTCVKIPCPYCSSSMPP